MTHHWGEIGRLATRTPSVNGYRWAFMAVVEKRNSPLAGASNDHAAEKAPGRA